MDIIIPTIEQQWHQNGLDRESAARLRARMVAADYKWLRNHGMGRKPIDTTGYHFTLTASQEHAAESYRASNTVRWDIYTENRPNLPAIVARWFNGATIIPAGIWKGETEPAAVIQILGSHSDRARVIILARDIRDTNAQSSVLVSWDGGNGRQTLNVR